MHGQLLTDLTGQLLTDLTGQLLTDLNIGSRNINVWIIAWWYIRKLHNLCLNRLFQKMPLYFYGQKFH